MERWDIDYKGPTLDDWVEETKKIMEAKYSSIKFG